MVADILFAWHLPFHYFPLEYSRVPVLINENLREIPLG